MDLDTDLQTKLIADYVLEFEAPSNKPKTDQRDKLSKLRRS